jgi:ABC-2 type transport system ATP-binding protein
VAIIEHGRVVDIGSPAALVDRHCPERSVVLVTDEATAAASLERVPHLRTLERQGTRFTLHGSGEEFVSDVIACLSEQHVRVTDFRTVLPSLEDVFLKLTGHSIRD